MRDYKYSREEIQNLCNALALIGNSCEADLYDRLARDLGRRHALVFEGPTMAPDSDADFIGRMPSRKTFVSAWRTNAFINYY